MFLQKLALFTMDNDLEGINILHISVFASCKVYFPLMNESGERFRNYIYLNGS